MKISQIPALRAAERELAETGVLSFPARRKLWEAMGPYEERPEDDPVPRALTEPLKKRAELALACARKAGRIWSACAPEDKRPQRLIRQTRAYLDGKISAEALGGESGVIDDFMSISDEEPGDSAPAAAIAAWNALVTALHDEPLLEPRYAAAADSDLDPYDWDAAKNAAMAWQDANTDGDPGRRAVREMKFWVWYLEEAAKLLGAENFKFPRKAVRAFEEKQNPPRPVPEEVTLENFTDYLGAGTYQYHVRSLPGIHEIPTWYELTARVYGESGVCPVCKRETSRLHGVMSFNYLETPLPRSPLPLRVIQLAPLFVCPDHPREWCFPPMPRVNPKPALKRYLAGPGRSETLLARLEERAVNACNLPGGSITLNGINKMMYAIDWIGFPRERGAYWLDRGREEFQIDLKVFGPHVYFKRLPYEEFCRQYPEKVRKLGDGSTELTMTEYWVRCCFGAEGEMERVVVRSRFRIKVKELAKCRDTLLQLLSRLLGLTVEQAAEAVDAAEEHMREWEMPVLSNLEKAEALRIQAALEKSGVDCRICPIPVRGEAED